MRKIRYQKRLNNFARANRWLSQDLNPVRSFCSRTLALNQLASSSQVLSWAPLLWESKSMHIGLGELGVGCGWGRCKCWFSTYILRNPKVHRSVFIIPKSKLRLWLCHSPHSLMKLLLQVISQLLTVAVYSWVDIFMSTHNPVCQDPWKTNAKIFSSCFSLCFDFRHQI